jgi:hypothetical protein
MRSAMIGMRLAEELRFPAIDRSALFYALLLKDLGCSSNAAKISYLFGADDRQVKRAARMADLTKPGQSLTYCWRNCAPGGSLVDKLLKVAAVARLGGKEPERSPKFVVNAVPTLPAPCSCPKRQPEPFCISMSIGTETVARGSSKGARFLSWVESAVWPRQLKFSFRPMVWSRLWMSPVNDAASGLTPSWPTR